jgi:antitoxin YefM
MVTIYRTKADELDESFLESVRAAFRGKEIEIQVSEHDESAYLLESKVNREQLLKAVGDINADRNIVRPEQSQFR